MQLAPCPHCQRHVGIHETTCPFCARSLADLDRTIRAMPAGRIGRAALFAFGLAAGCGDNAPRVVDAGPDAHPDAMPDASLIDAGPVAIYSAAPTPDKKSDG